MSVSKDDVAAQEAIDNWFARRGWTPHAFQLELWNATRNGQEGLLQAPTGSGKTYGAMIPVILKFWDRRRVKEKRGVKLIWIAPIRALTREIEHSAKVLLRDLGFDWDVGVRTGDVSAKEKARQRIRLPEILITTPESLHVLLAMKGRGERFASLEFLVVDEWHELMGSKRGVQVELASSLLKSISPSMCVWGISATMGNLDEAMQTLLGNREGKLIRANWKKKRTITSLMPAKLERLAWSGHLGLALLEQVLDVIERHGSTLIFTNTRAQAEIWYRHILEADPLLSGAMALHHGSISKDLRHWVEDALHEGRLKAVVCTSSLDLGVDFRPVDAVIQIGGAKGVARFAQRAGRSGHAPHETSQIYFLPTHGLELIEASALRNALEMDQMESRLPVIRSFDVLVQFLCTLAVGDGFLPKAALPVVRATHAFESMNEEEWSWCLQFITTGGKALEAYSDYQRVQIVEGVWRILDKKLARKHRMSIGTIVSDAMLGVRWVKGKKLGHVEEYFVAGMEVGDSFWFAGLCLEFVRFKDLTVFVKRSKKSKGRIPVYMGGRLALSSELGEGIRKELDAFANERINSPEMNRVRPLLELQSKRSCLPKINELLVESFQSKDGFHVCVFPFEGRDVHEGMGMLLAHRWSQMKPISFSIACNDYGFEMLSDQPIPISELWTERLWSPENLMDDLQAGVNASEMAKRRFRDISVISGLTFQGFGGKSIQGRHLQSHAGLVFEVFRDFDPANLLYQQAYEELLHHQLQWRRMRLAMQRIVNQQVVFSNPDFPTPFSFPLVVDRLRSSLSSEDLESRINKMLLESRA